ncbi:NAD(P)/FAD-dependent oxidoreductase [Streptomyces sp. NPDC086023]|uniref:NAD(P)/FAD-dependent oxidoreductase n=1 Tax=Streptomyces sp. NPDC086023 TaxID=3365746 RepID=UPI0037D49569
MAVEHDAIVVGAGMAGLACAADLVGAGLRVVLLEGSDGPGGRVRTDRRDGFLLDRGFQVFNTAYPQVKRRFDLRALRLHPFTPGVVAHTPSGPVRLVDPSRRREGARTLLPGRALSARDLAALSALTLRDAFLPARALKGRGDRSTREALRRAGLTPDLVDHVLRPFLSGVFLEDRLETSARYFHLVWRSMARGTLCLPAGGIGAAAAQLAAALPEGTLRLGTPVAAVTDTGVLLADGRDLAARTVVVATDARTAAALLPGLAVPAQRTATTFYYATDDAPLTEPVLLLDSTMTVLNTCVLSAVVPGYAPPGTALVSASVLGTDTPERERTVRRRLGELYGSDPARWDLVATYPVTDALPAMPPPWPLTRTTRFAPARYVCGDHRATGSVQGALASGTRAATELLTDLARARRARP